MSPDCVGRAHDMKASARGEATLVPQSAPDDLLSLSAYYPQQPSSQVHGPSLSGGQGQPSNIISIFLSPPFP